MGAVLREQNALPRDSRITVMLTAKDAIDNGGAGRAAKGENPSFWRGRRVEEGLNYRGFARASKDSTVRNIRIIDLKNFQISVELLPK